MDITYTLTHINDVDNLHEDILYLKIEGVRICPAIFKKCPNIVSLTLKDINGIDCMIFKYPIYILKFINCTDITNIPHDTTHMEFAECHQMKPAEFDGLKICTFKMNACSPGTVISNIVATEIHLTDVDVEGFLINATHNLQLCNVRNMPQNLPQTIKILKAVDTKIPNDLNDGIRNLKIHDYNGQIDIPQNVEKLNINNCKNINFAEITNLPNLKSCRVRKVNGFSWRKYAKFILAINFKFKC